MKVLGITDRMKGFGENKKNSGQDGVKDQEVDGQKNVERD